MNLRVQEKSYRKNFHKRDSQKIQYLDTLFRAFCISTTDISVSPDLEGEARENQKIISKAIKLGILQSDSETPFKANSTLTKIEALALLFRLTDIQIQADLSNYNFLDVEDNWKQEVAAKATHLGLVYTSNSKNSFYPNRVMNQGDAYRMLKQMSKYYY
ncbi:hypothetical protein N9J72_01470 [Candidatus Gracilibacteria bacterium]|nr:hypothetical protein [Candidatus Gracilibacteria bacterium]